MPNKDPTLWAAMLAWLMDNWPAVYGALLAMSISFLRITYDGGSGRRRLIESVMGGLLTLAVSTGATELGVASSAAPFIGGMIGLLGVDIVRDKAKTLFNKKGSNDAAQ
ncbi:TPA: phage holin, lambda family [Aeromonas veronii]|uniref:phage holin, lambda family n=1 Tax=Aeromonas veronii TaxID=654 RepID=UPI001A306AEA|nr:phage holin, lambda family [Aeromonas veronii]HAU4895851.1 phage holin, lambda family [Aeromonas hydrophila]HAU4977106.1 phage holin, lambda family [Aeromonas hydrophila]HAU4986004.1 phage holin, lambda family [Aeromonas hydrophila]